MTDLDRALTEIRRACLPREPAAFDLLRRPDWWRLSRVRERMAIWRRLRMVRKGEL